MGELRFDPVGSFYDGTAPGIAGGAGSIHAALSDESDTTYIFYDEGVIPPYTKIALRFDNVRTGLPSGAVITGLAFYYKCRSNLEGRFFYFTDFVNNSNFNQRTVSPEWPIGLIYDGNWQEFTTVSQPSLTQGSQQGSTWWNDVIGSTTDILVGIQLWGGELTAESQVAISEAELVVYYNEKPTVSAVALTGYVAGEVFTANPEITYTYTDPEGDAQGIQYVIVGREDTNDANGNAPGSGSFNPLLWGAGEAYEAAVYTSSKSHVVGGEGLVNGTQYRAYVRASQTPIFGADPFYSSWAFSSAFTIDAPGPDTFETHASQQGANARNRVHGWNKADGGAGRFPAEYELQRSVDAGLTWVPCRGFENGPIPTEQLGLYHPGTASHYAATADAASLDITSDIDLRIWLSRSSNVGGGTFIAKWGAAGQRSYKFALTFGLFVFSWTVAGTTQIDAIGSTGPALLGEDYEPMWLRVTADFQASQTVVTFYYSKDYSLTPTWTQAGNQVIVSGASSMHSGTAALAVGAESAGANQLSGTQVIHYAEVRNGIGGTVVANPDFRTQDIGDGNFNDGTGKTWSLNGASLRYTRGFHHYDYEAGHNKSTIYRSRSAEFTDPNQYYGSWVSSEATTMLLLDGKWYLKLFDAPEYNVVVDLGPESLDERAPKEKAVYKPLGSKYPVVLSDGLKAGVWPFRFELNSAAEKAALRLLAEQDLVVFMQSNFPEWQDGRYISLGDWNSEMEDPTGQYWTVRMDGTEVARP